MLLELLYVVAETVIQPTKQALDESWRVLGSCFALAALAGLFGAMARKMKMRDTIIAAGVSGVGGLVVGAICVSAWGPERWYLTSAACSLAGWAGGNLVLDRLTFVAWTIVRGKVPSIGDAPDEKEVPLAPSDSATGPASPGVPAVPPHAAAPGGDARL